MEAGKSGVRSKSAVCTCRVSAAKEEVVVSKEASGTFQCMTTVLVAKEVCFLAKQDMGGDIANDVCKVMQAVGA